MIDVLATVPTVLAVWHPFAYPWRFLVSLYLSALVGYIKAEPVRFAAMLLAIAIVVGSVVTGVPASTIVAAVLGIVATLEKVRDAVTPAVDVVVHSKDVPAGHEVVVRPKA